MSMTTIAELSFREKKTLDFWVNGQKISEPNPDPQETLISLLRRLGFTGTKLGCGEGNLMNFQYFLFYRKIKNPLKFFLICIDSNMVRIHTLLFIIISIFHFDLIIFRWMWVVHSCSFSV